MADGDLHHTNSMRQGQQHDLWSQMGQQQQQQHANNPFLAMRLPQGLFPYPTAMAGHPYAAHPAALAAHHAAAAAAWNNLKSGNPIAAAAAAAGFQQIPRYWLPPHWPAQAFDPLAMTTTPSAHPESTSPPQQDYISASFVHQQLQHPNHHQGDSRSPVSNSSSASSSSPSSIRAGDSPTPEPEATTKVHRSVDKAILDLRVKIAGPEETSLLASK